MNRLSRLQCREYVVGDLLAKIVFQFIKFEVDL